MKISGAAVACVFACFALVSVAQSAEPTSAADAASTPPPASERFNVFEYRVLGSSVLPRKDVETVLYSHLGPDKTLDDVEKARVALEQLFRQRGYPSVFVDIPTQDVDQGIVRLAVTEARLARVRAMGARYFSQRKILNEIPAARAGEVLYLPALREQLDDVNRESQDRVVTPVLRAGPRPGTVDLDLRVTDELPFHPSVEINDRYTANTERWRAVLNLGYDNVGQRGDQIGLMYQTAPEDPDDTSILSLNYTMRLAPDHLLALYALDSNSDIQAVGTLGVLGTGRVYGFRDVRILPTREGASQNVSCGADYKDYADTINLVPESEGSDEEVASIESGISYVNLTCQYSQAIAKGLLDGPTRFSFGANFGIRGLGNDPEEFGVKRFKARPNYFALDASASQLFPLPGGPAFFLAADGQYSVEPLINNEQFAAGGVDSVRGYAESQILADYGVRLSGELQSGRLGAGLWERAGFSQFQLFAFVDYATLRLHEPLPEQVADFSLLGAGAGIRLAWNKLTAQLHWAQALEDNGSVQSGDSRWHVMMHMGW